MASQTIPMEELQTLLVSLGAWGEEHLEHVETDIDRANVLLREAIAMLVQGFMAINRASQTQQALLLNLSVSEHLSQAEISEVAMHSRQIESEVNRIVTGLQFEDMTNQLLTRALHRVGGLKTLLLSMAEQHEKLIPEHGSDDLAVVLQKMSESLNEKRASMHKDLKSSVNQQHMGAGDIELF
ncbi:chemotaxis protein [Methylobacillus gramineus]|uniref:chemotaxis protein n=1 Tax=Methylobacillus gramineus TaxID=755169 RepID=UPI001CFF70B4|nr:chemotaxis protein [Methylobacillus gramineus]MCB5183803.1 chemotaxis protein [Methylobacillus gramineus]